MLKMSTRTRYALRSLLEMACRPGQGPFKLAELARHQGISRKYLENIFGVLREHGIVRSKIGKNGGFFLPGGLEKISILRIVEVLEGKVDIVRCVGPAKRCKRLSICPASMIWRELNTAIKSVLAAKHLKDLAGQEDIRKKCAYFGRK